MTEPTVGDAFGNALLAHLEEGGTAGTHQIERDDGYSDEEVGDTYFDGAAPWDGPETEARSLARGRVLAVGAGAAKQSLVLQDEGCDVLALDVSPGAIEVCRRRGVEHTHFGEASTLGPDERFDTFLLFGNNLGLLGSPAAAPGFLRPLRERAAPGARLLGTIIDPYRTENPEHLSYHDRNRLAGRPPGQIRMRTLHRGVATDWHDLLWLNLPELEGVLDGTGWVIDRVFDDGWFIYAVALSDC